MAGAVVAPWVEPALGPCLAAAAALCVVGLLGWRYRATWLVVPAAGLCLGLAAAAGGTGPPDLPDRAAILGRVQRVAGSWLVIQTPVGRVGLRSDQPARVGDTIAAWTTTASDPPVLPGDPVPVADDQRAGIRPLRARQVLVLGQQGGRPDPFGDSRHPGLLRALALGDRSGVDDATRGLLRRTGTSHLLAISGLHVGLLAGAAAALAWLLSRPLVLGRWWPLARVLPACAAAVAAVAYASVVGSPASARRAAVMVGLAAGAVVLGRRPRPWTLLALAAIVLVLHDPGVVGDLGFQLSFSAVAGMLLVGPRVTRWLPPDQPAVLRWVVRSLAATAGATAGTLPLVAWRFQELAPVAPLANLVVAPLVGTVVVPAAVSGALLPGPLARVGVDLADLGLDLALALLTALDHPTWTPAVGPLGVLLLALALLARRQAAVAALLCTLALGLRELPRQRLTLTFLAVGQGDATLVQWPDGRAWLVDGGPMGSAVLRYLRRRGIRHLDALVLTHDHPDHSGGLLPVAQALDFDRLWLSHPPEEPSGEAFQLWQLAWQRGVPVQGPDDPAPPGVVVEHPVQGWRARGHDRVNEESLVLRLQHGRHSALLTGDIEEDAEALLARTLMPATLVKVPHHGSRTSSSRGLVDASRPAVAVVPVGRRSRFGHPHREALAAWRRRGRGPWCGFDLARASPDCSTRLLRTDVDGTIEWSTDGRTWRLRTWRADRGWTRLAPPDPT